MGRGRGRLGSSANRSRSPCLRCKVGVQGLGAGSSALGCFFLLVEGVWVCASGRHEVPASHTRAVRLSSDWFVFGS